MQTLSQVRLEVKLEDLVSQANGRHSDGVWCVSLISFTLLTMTRSIAFPTSETGSSHKVHLQLFTLIDADAIIVPNF